MKRKTIGGLFAAAVLLAGIGWFENCTIQKTEYILLSSRLPTAFDGLRAALVADLHGQQFGKDNGRLLKALRELEPDIIVLDGDLADEYTDISSLRPFLAGVQEIAPAFFVTGNHEWVLGREKRQELFRLLDEFGVIRLENAYRLLQRGDSAIVVAGVDDQNGPADQKAPAQLMTEIREVCGDAYTLVLCHRNDKLDLWAELGADTVLSGHAHGGIVRLPFLGPVFGTHYDWFPRDAEGIYQKGDTTLFVSRGLGGSHRLPLRVGNRPELALLILKSEKR